VLIFVPLGTTRPCWRVPYATYGLIAANVAVFAIELAAPDALPKGFVPAQPSVFAWLLAMFMHAGFLHIAGNMVFLWLFGTITEDVLGPGMFLLFYFGGNIGATLLDVLVSGASSSQALAVPRVGASGAIAGIMGLSAVCFIRTKVRIWYFFTLFWIYFWRTGTVEVAAPVVLGLWAGWELVQGTIQSVAGFVGGVGHWAHVGGFLFGLLGSIGLGLNKRIPRSDLISGRVPVQSAADAYQQAGELQRMVLESPEDADAWTALARDFEMTGRIDRAKEGHAKALSLYLAQRNTQGAAEAYAALSSYGIVAQLTPDQQFDLACALEEAGKAKDAFGLFRLAANEHPDQQTAETALVRAAEMARMVLDDPQRAAECYQRLLERYPFSNWRALAQERLREMNLPEHTTPPETTSAPADTEPETDAGLRRL